MQLGRETTLKHQHKPMRVCVRVCQEDRFEGMRVCVCV